MPAVELFWYDGGMKPRLPEELEDHDVEMQREGILFVGDEGASWRGFHGQEPELFARGKRQPLPEGAGQDIAPGRTIARSGRRVD